MLMLIRTIRIRSHFGSRQRILPRPRRSWGPGNPLPWAILVWSRLALHGGGCGHSLALLPVYSPLPFAHSAPMVFLLMLLAMVFADELFWYSARG